MWRAEDGKNSQRPVRWLAQIDTVKFLETLENKLKVPGKDFDLVTTKRGGTNPGTWGHYQVALAYAKYLSPEFHIWCNEVVKCM